MSVSDNGNRIRRTYDHAVTPSGWSKAGTVLVAATGLVVAMGGGGTFLAILGMEKIGEVERLLRLQDEETDRLERTYRLVIDNRNEGLARCWSVYRGHMADAHGFTASAAEIAQ